MALCVFQNVMANKSIMFIRALFLNNISDFQRSQVRVFTLQQSSIHYAIAFASSIKQVNIEITSRIESSSVHLHPLFNTKYLDNIVDYNIS
jgi:hypothetical protein